MNPICQPTSERDDVRAEAGVGLGRQQACRWCTQEDISVVWDEGKVWARPERARC